MAGHSPLNVVPESSDAVAVMANPRCASLRLELPMLMREDLEREKKHTGDIRLANPEGATPEHSSAEFMFVRMRLYIVKTAYNDIRLQQKCNCEIMTRQILDKQR